MLHFIESHNRIRRAQEHATTFTNAYLKFLYGKPYGVVHEMRDDRNGIIKLVPLKSLDWDLPLILGEYFYQMRAALDGAMWKAYKLCGLTQGAPKINERDIYFPICGTTSSLNKAAFQWIPLPNKLGDWLYSIQPCHRTEVANEITENLVVINKRSKADRHRQLHLVGAVVRTNAPLITLSPPAKLTYANSVPADPMKGEYIIGEFGIEGLVSETKMDVDTNFSVNIEVEELPMDSDLKFTLFNLIGTVQQVVGKFEAAFRDTVH